MDRLRGDRGDTHIVCVGCESHKNRRIEQIWDRRRWFQSARFSQQFGSQLIGPSVNTFVVHFAKGIRCSLVALGCDPGRIKILSFPPWISIAASSWRCLRSPVSSSAVCPPWPPRDACEGLKSGSVRRASTGVSPLLRWWLPSPDVAEKKPCCLEKKRSPIARRSNPLCCYFCQSGR